MLSRLAMLLRLSDCLFFTFRCQPALVRMLVTLCAAAMTSFRRWSWSLCLAQLTPAYGVTSICRFVQAATTLPIILMSLSRQHLPPLVSIVSPIFRCHLQSLHLLSCFVRRHSSALRPVFTQLAHTAALFYPVPLVFLWKERDSNPRYSQIYEASTCIDFLLSTTQPSFRKIRLFSRTVGLHNLKSCKK